MNNEAEPWRAAPVRLTFPFDHIEVWRICLSACESSTGGRSVLSSDEIARAERFHFTRDRQHFVRCRSAVREILGRYLGIPAQDIHFSYEANGKPQVVEDQNPQQLRFNISHSSGLAVIAVASVRTDQRAATRWSLANLEPREGFIGALAVEGPPQPTERWFFNGADAES